MAPNAPLESQDSPSYYSKAMEHPLMQRALSTYERAKSASPLVNSVLGSVENRVANAFDKFYVKPRESLSQTYNSSMALANQSGAIMIGTGVAITQITLQLGVFGASYLLDKFGVIQETGKTAISQVKTAELAFEELLMKYIKENAPKLKGQLEVLKGKGQTIFGDNTMAEKVLVYLQELDSKLGDAKDIQEVRDELRQRLSTFMNLYFKKAETEKKTEETVASNSSAKTIPPIQAAPGGFNNNLGEKRSKGRRGDKSRGKRAVDELRNDPLIDMEID